MLEANRIQVVNPQAKSVNDMSVTTTVIYRAGGTFTAIAFHTATPVPGRRPGSIGSVVESPVHGEQANEARYR